jgi:hypothetical protein
MGTYNPEYDFVLDNKKTLNEAIYIVGNTGYTNINLQANAPYQILANDERPVFKDLTALDTKYYIELSDYAIRVSSATYTDIYMPIAAGLGGYSYFIINNSGHNVNVLPRNGDTIETKIVLKLGHTEHTNLISDNFNTWHTI